jgi:type I restriction enzyme S subunit
VKTLGEIAYITAGQGAPQKKDDYSEYGIPFIKAGNLNALINGASELSVQKVSEEVAKRNKLKIFPKGTILFAKSGMSCMKGYVYELCNPCYVVNHLACIILEKDLPRFIKYFLEYNPPNLLIKDSAYPSISLSDIANINISLPSLSAQQEIVNALDQVCSLIKKRKIQIVKLDMLVKSRFLEMFGDPMTNNKGWAKKPIKEFATVKIGPFGSLLHVEDYIENGIPLVNPSHIINGKIIVDPRLTITHEKYKEMSAYKLKTGDVVLGRRGEIGRCAVVDDNEYLCGTGSMFIRIKNDYLPLVLQKIISSDAMREILENNAVGVTMMNLNAGVIANLEIIIPPLSLQTQFAEFVQQADKSGFVLQKGLEKLELCYKSLMQQYFG